MKKEIKIMNNDVYDDVTMAKIVFRIGGRNKKMKCLWRTLRMRNRKAGHRMARGSFPIRYKPRGGFLPALVIKLSNQSMVGVIPYRHVTWDNFGNDIYLLNYDESIVSDDDYRLLIRILYDWNADTITIDDAAKDKEHDGETFLVNKGKVWRGWNE